MEDFDHIELKAQIDEITKTIDDIISRVTEYEEQANKEKTRGDELTEL